MISGINSRMKFYYTYKYRDFLSKIYKARIYTQKLRDYTIYWRLYRYEEGSRDNINLYIYIYIYRISL